MKKTGSRGIKLIIALGALLLFMALAYFTNPSKEDYLRYDQENTGISIPENVHISESDFLFFSIFASSPENTIDEFGKVHIGFMGFFLQVSDGQYDDSVWKNFLE